METIAQLVEKAKATLPLRAAPGVRGILDEIAVAAKMLEQKLASQPAAGPVGRTYSERDTFDRLTPDLPWGCTGGK